MDEIIRRLKYGDIFTTECGPYVGRRFRVIEPLDSDEQFYCVDLDTGSEDYIDLGDIDPGSIYLMTDDWDARS